MHPALLEYVILNIFHYGIIDYTQTVSTSGQKTITITSDTLLILFITNQSCHLELPSDFIVPYLVFDIEDWDHIERMDSFVPHQILGETI